MRKFPAYRDPDSGFCVQCQTPDGMIVCMGPDACACCCHDDHGGVYD